MHEEDKILKLLDTVDDEYKSIVNPILYDDEFLKRKEYHHHEDVSVYYHCLQVSIKSYKYCKKHKLNYRDAAIGGLLHDFYYYDWQTSKIKAKKINEMHGFAHARWAHDNAMKCFPNLMNERIEDIILKHMFPLNIKLPKYRESWVITKYDKICSLDVFLHPKAWPKYVGLKKKVK